MSMVRRIREARGLTQRELARLGGTSQPTIAAYESGARTPNFRTLERLARAAGLELQVGFVAAMSREERRSLALHLEIARKLRLDPDRVLAKARVNLGRMQRLHPDAAQLLSNWQEILDRPLEDIVETLTDPGPHCRELRHITPFAGVLDARERAAVYRRFRRDEAGR